MQFLKIYDTIYPSIDFLGIEVYFCEIFKKADTDYQHRLRLCFGNTGSNQRNQPFCKIKIRKSEHYCSAFFFFTPSLIIAKISTDAVMLSIIPVEKSHIINEYVIQQTRFAKIANRILLAFFIM